MIKIVEGNLLNATEDIIGHQVNCKGVMGSGVALQIRNKYPEAYQQYQFFYHTFCKNPEKMLGMCQLVEITDTNKYVANLYGQLDYGRGKQQTNTNMLKTALIKLKNKAKDKSLSVALPYKIGSDRGGADWTEVSTIIDEVFSDYEVILYKYNG